jgi:erythronate-4-phosphate dehydrogenase
MKIVLDENISFAEEAFQEFGSLYFYNGRLINRETLKDADALIIRSITRVNKNLLLNTPVKFIGTVTVGTDHIDTEYLLKNKITFADAKGCNADSVAEYVFTALLKIAIDEELILAGKTIGIVGIGNIGSRIAKIARSLGLRVLKNDPPKERRGIGSGYAHLDEILSADIISLHVPLTKAGIDRTFHLLNRNNLNRIKEGAIIVNTSRGEVIDNMALNEAIKIKKFKLALDVWENEPDINIELLKNTKIGTAHIAGYSLEGKVKGTEMIYKALCKHRNIKPAWQPNIRDSKKVNFNLRQGRTIEDTLYNLFSSIYSIERDDKKLKGIFMLGTDKIKEYFDKIRKEYPTRREFINYEITLQKNELKIASILEALRFKVERITNPPFQV